jgi:hypothetical protein
MTWNSLQLQTVREVERGTRTGRMPASAAFLPTQLIGVPMSHVSTQASRLPLPRTALSVCGACLIGLAAMLPAAPVSAQTAATAASAPAKPTAKPAAAAPKPAAAATSKPAAAKAKAPHKAASKAASAPVAEAPLPPATPEQVNAAERIFYGVSGCEFKQTLDISINPKYPAYADVTFAKKTYTMKPVLSPTGAMRLEDVKNQAVLIQIAQKSMLLNTVSGQRLVDDCVHPKQRELMELAKQAAIAESAAASAASAAATAASAAAAIASAAAK